MAIHLNFTMITFGEIGYSDDVGIDCVCTYVFFFFNTLKDIFIRIMYGWIMYNALHM